MTRPATSQGALGRLWAEFTDPGPRGDTLVFLKNHLDGIGPGCMGVLFMAVGIFVGILGYRSRAAGGKWYVPIIFGAVFALAGFGVFRLGVSAILKKAGRDGA